MGFTSNIRFAAGASVAINFHKYATGFAELHAINIYFSPKWKRDFSKTPTSKTVAGSHCVTHPTLLTFPTFTSLESFSDNVSCVGSVNPIRSLAS